SCSTVCRWKQKNSRQKKRRLRKRRRRNTRRRTRRSRSCNVCCLLPPIRGATFSSPSGITRTGPQRLALVVRYPFRAAGCGLSAFYPLDLARNRSPHRCARGDLAPRVRGPRKEHCAMKTPFPGRVLLIGCGYVGRCTLPLLVRHLDVPANRITVLD